MNIYCRRLTYYIAAQYKKRKEKFDLVQVAPLEIKAPKTSNVLFFNSLRVIVIQNK
jgi:hypothetical protein